jgi:hypothetical protein
MFSHYEKIVVRWPHIKLHAFIVYDREVEFLSQMFELDRQLFHEMRSSCSRRRE